MSLLDLDSGMLDGWAVGKNDYEERKNNVLAIFRDEITTILDTPDFRRG